MDATILIFGLITIAIILFVLDIFLPSGGALIGLSVVCATAGVIFAFREDWRTGSRILLAVLAASPFLIWGAIHYWPQTPIGKMVLGRKPESPDEVLPNQESNQHLQTLIGVIGKAESDLLPSGSVIVKGHRYDANSLSGPIDRGQPIEVVGLDMGRLKVRYSNRPAAVASANSSKPVVPQTDEQWLDQSIEELGLESISDNKS